MRIVLVTYGSRGDIEPMAALALQLQDLGVGVRMCAPPDFAELLDGTGIPVTPIGWPIRALAIGALGGLPKTLADIAAKLTAMIYEAVATAANGCDAVVATGSPPAMAGARAAAEKLGIRYLATALSPYQLPSPHHKPVFRPGSLMPPEEVDRRVLWDFNAEHLNELFGEPVNTHRASIGLPPRDNIRDHILTDKPFLAADPVLGPWPQPAYLDVTQTGAWIRPDERRLPTSLQAFLEAGTPTVYVGFSSMPMRAATEIARAAIEAVRAHGGRVLLNIGWANLALIDERNDCFVVGEVNQQALFHRVAAVVHHGGAGTTTAAASAGAPQLVVPQGVDQHYWADRVTELGLGMGHDGPTPTAGSLSTALDVVLAPQTVARAAALAKTVRADGAEQAAKLLLEMKGHRGFATAPG
ncbi:glycosyltransferase [Micromonospora sp. NBC_00362]|uniref:glycosyltransferase n=1 Tax=Micromonospora sp. NBC_00362 TaxID=2975975 RepID=UPI00225AEEF2|nr:glycosyltransferase [Micromonospora sp. NBC_00362]MCX5121746.1 glycosyltransferase [Micromonospora sp. NBC_00362]